MGENRGSEPAITSNNAGAANASSSTHGILHQAHHPHPIIADQVHFIKQIVSHIQNHTKCTIDFEVEWWDGDTTREPEWSLQIDAPQVVYDYWSYFDGGRDEATGFEQHYIHKILGHRRKRRGNKTWMEYKVQWVGYPEEVFNWEKADKVEAMAGGMKEAYDRENGVIV
ncbi:hypothetical protein F53441_5396 [Fusarium austroafricanum]|uniref:Chromo domain-containing protein n=1 Tax=Fusarium austroafricanum TaxID=2364996 RepID=A0A8H4KIB1_9HYPO|nr:hypothetical protein F53441_5396 [Fusarium austroafricanum]